MDAGELARRAQQSSMRYALFGSDSEASSAEERGRSRISGSAVEAVEGGQPSATVPSNDPIADSSGNSSDEMPGLYSDSDSDVPPSAVRPTQRANPPPIQHHQRHHQRQHQQPSDSDADSFPDLLSDSNSDQERTRPVQRPLLQQITRLAQAPQPNSALPSPTQRRHQPRLPPELVSRLSQLSQNRRIASIEMVNERLPVHQWSAADAPDGKSDCGICISEFEEQDSVRTLPCKHLFHSNCVDQWLTQGSVTCPSCRHPALDLPRIEPPSIGDIRLLLDILAPERQSLLSSSNSGPSRRPTPQYIPQPFVPTFGDSFWTTQSSLEANRASPSVNRSQTRHIIPRNASLSDDMPMPGLYSDSDSDDSVLRDRLVTRQQPQRQQIPQRENADDSDRMPPLLGSSDESDTPPRSQPPINRPQPRAAQHQNAPQNASDSDDMPELVGSTDSEGPSILRNPPVTRQEPQRQQQPQRSNSESSDYMPSLVISSDDSDASEIRRQQLAQRFLSENHSLFQAPAVAPQRSNTSRNNAGSQSTHEEAEPNWRAIVEGNTERMERQAELDLAIQAASNLVTEFGMDVFADVINQRFSVEEESDISEPPSIDDADSGSEEQYVDAQETLATERRELQMMTGAAITTVRQMVMDRLNHADEDDGNDADLEDSEGEWTTEEEEVD